MSIIYILIAITFTAGGNDLRITQTEYRGLDACEAAAAEIHGMVSTNSQDRWVPPRVRTKCVPKSSEH